MVVVPAIGAIVEKLYRRLRGQQKNDAIR